MSPDHPAHLTIVRADHAHLDALVEGNARMALETENLALDRLRLRAGVGAVLDDPAKGFYLVATRGEAPTPVGQLMVTFEWSDWRNGVFFWIQSVYVWPEARRQGVYRALYAELVRIAEERRDVSGIRLYVERENRRAQSTYAALGMKRAHYDMFEVDFVLARG